MSKRSNTSLPSSPKKKAKSIPGQHRLDQFFSRDSPTTSSPAKRPRADGTLTETLSGQGQHVTDAMCSDATGEPEHGLLEVIDVDALDLEDSRCLTQNAVDSSALRDHMHSDPVKHSDRAKLVHNSGSTEVPTYPVLNQDPVTFSTDISLGSKNGTIPFSFLAHTLASLTQTRSRTAILNIVTNALRIIALRHPASLLPALYLLSNSISPPYEPIELGLGSAVISRAIQDVSGLTSSALKRLYNETGDPGDVAFLAKSNVRTLIPHAALSIADVYSSLLRIASSKGQGAAKQKGAIVQKLLVAAKGEETRFLVRALVQNNRVGAARTSILSALARAMALTSPQSLNATHTGPSEYHVSAELVAEVAPLSDAGKSASADPVRQEVLDRFRRAEALLKRVFVKHPSYNDIVQGLLHGGLDGLQDRVPLTVGVPLHPTLGSPARSVDEIYERLGDLPFAAEFKYDGQRAQIHAHKDDGLSHVKIFSRHLEDMTDKYPDVVELVDDIFVASPSTTSFVIDAEIVAVDARDGAIRSFQDLSNRARKVDNSDDIKVVVCIFAFDLMYLDNQILLSEPFRLRRNLLRSRFPAIETSQRSTARFAHVESCESEGGRDAVEDFWQRAVESQCEGLMIKLLDSGDLTEAPASKPVKSRKKGILATYEPDKRTWAWLKLKKDYVQGLGDSLDLVPIGAWHGNGRKAQWWSPILLAVRESHSGTLVAMCKCMSGFTDAFYKEMRALYTPDSEHCSTQNLWAVETGGLKPEVFFKPQEVWEIRGADVTISPVSIAGRGLVDGTRGCSLRFPRFIKTREDKTIEEASTPEFLANMYRMQQEKGKAKGTDQGDLIDVEIQSEVPESEDDSN